MAKLARIDQRLAELQAEQASLLAERSQVFVALADGEVELPTMRRGARLHVPALPKISETDRARARRELNSAGLRRRLG